MLRPSIHRAARREAAARVKLWTRERFGLAAQDVVSVAQHECRLPGCPPLQTVILFWDGAAKRHRLTVFKPLAEVRESDLPPAWMKGALAAAGDAASDWCC